MIQAVIFNLDGVLVSTDECHFFAWAQLAREQGIPLNRETYRDMVGKKRMDSLRVLLKRAERTYTPAEMWALSARKNDIFNGLIDQLPAERILPGAIKNVQGLREMGVKTAVCSSSENAGCILRKLKMDRMFDAVVDGGQIENGKPDPEVFLLAARKLLIPTSTCLVVENTNAGVEAARQAGMKILALCPVALNGRKDALPEGLKDVDIPALLKENAIGQYLI